MKLSYQNFGGPGGLRTISANGKRTVELKHFTLVKRIVEEGSVTKAAEGLFLSQSALSHQLREVESELGVLLFHRIKTA